MSRKGRVIAAILILIGIILFFYLNPLGIQIGYRIAGGSTDPVTETANPDEILHRYYQETDTYERYHDSNNPTAQKWANAAKEKADSLAEQYEQLTGMKP